MRYRARGVPLARVRAPPQRVLLEAERAGSRSAPQAAAALRGVHREEVTETSWVSSEDPHSLLDEKQWTAGVREQVDFLLDGLGENSGVAARVIVLEESPAAVAYACELPVGYVYRIARTGRRLLADNAMLHSMLKERS